MDLFRELFEIAGLPTLSGAGRIPPVFKEDVKWALEHIKKYPEPGNGKVAAETVLLKGGEEWVVVERERSKKDSLSFI